MNAFSIRPATRHDRTAIRNLVFGVLAEYGLQPDPEGTDSDLDDIETIYQLSGGCFDVLLNASGQIIGTVGLFPLSREVCELRKMYLSSTARGQGHGRRMLEHALATATARGFTRITLETASVLKKPLHFTSGMDSAAAPRVISRRVATVLMNSTLILRLCRNERHHDCS